MNHGRISAILSFLVLILLAACQAPNPLAEELPTATPVLATSTAVPAPTVSPSLTPTRVPTAEPTATPEATVTPSATATSQPTMTPTLEPEPTATAESAGADLSPLLIGDHLRFNGWTPDGRLIAIWVASAENAVYGPRHPAPGAELWFVNPDSGETCVHAQFSAETAWRGSVSWLDNGDALVRLNDVISPGGDGPGPAGNNRYFSGTPCQADAFAEVPDPRTPSAVDASAFGKSPNGTYYVETIETGVNTELGPEQTTTIFASATGQPLVSYDYIGAQGIGGPGLNGAWLNDTLFVMRYAQGVENGPVLLDASTGSITQIVSELFGITEPVPRYEGDLIGYGHLAFGVMNSAENTYTIVLQTGSGGSDAPPLQLYDSGSQSVEVLTQFSDVMRPAGTADGQWIRVLDAQDNTWIRPTVKLGGDWIPLGQINYRALWPDTTDWLLNSQLEIVTFQQLGAEAPALTLSTAPYRTDPVGWSPDSSYAVLIGQDQSASSMALFIVEPPQP